MALALDCAGAVGASLTCMYDGVGASCILHRIQNGSSLIIGQLSTTYVSSSAIRTIHLTKTFDNFAALRDVSFEVESGEIFGLLGPNGAGKSTMMMILTTLLKPTSGRAVVSGFDVVGNPGGVRRSIGYVQQDVTIDEYLTGRENLYLQARLSRMPKEKAARRIDEMLHLVEIQERQDEPTLTYSGGMRKRLEIAAGLLHMPDVLFLDEPTVGLDIQTRRKIWEYIKTVNSEYGMTVFLTTHYMEEADNLCDRVGIIDGGKIVGIDTPAAMKESLGGGLVSMEVDCGHLQLVERLSKDESGLISDVRYDPSSERIVTSGDAAAIPRIFQAASDCNITVKRIAVSTPTLDDVFLSHTGHGLRDGDGRDDGQQRRRGGGRPKRRAARGG